MTDNTDDPRFPQFPNDDTGALPVMGYRLLMHQSLYSAAPDLQAAMREIECCVSRRILKWLETSDYLYYADYIRLVTEDTLNSEFMTRLEFGLWRHMDASMWLKWEDANGSSSYLWKQAILTAARSLNTPARA